MTPSGDELGHPDILKRNFDVLAASVIQASLAKLCEIKSFGSIPEYVSIVEKLDQVSIIASRLAEAAAAIGAILSSPVQNVTLQKTI